VAALDAAGRAAGLDRDAWRRQSSGDGEVAVLPADADEPAVLNAFVVALDRRLRPYNARLQPHVKIRTRVAIHEGLVFLDSRNGFAGHAVVSAARLVDAPVLKKALKSFPDAAVACIVSESIHRDVISGGYEGIRPERFRKVRVTLVDKDFDESAWLQIVDEDITSNDLSLLDDGPDPEVVPPRGPHKRGDSAPGSVSVGDIRNHDGQIAVGHHAIASGGNTALGSGSRDD
jgi:hypothetical protein